MEVPALAELIRVEGTAGAPVIDVNISGVIVTGQRPTFLEPHGHPSGGDWGLERLGAIRLRFTEAVSITDALFTTLDGNAVFLDG